MRSTYTFQIVLIVTAVAALNMGGCKHSEKSAPDTGKIPADLKIILGQQGTFAGRTMGYSIDGDGSVAKWEGKHPEENVLATASVEANHVRELWNHAQRIGFLEMQNQVMSNVHYFVTLTANGDSRRVTWVQRDEQALTPAQNFYDACRAVARSALGEESAGAEG